MSDSGIPSDSPCIDPVTDEANLRRAQITAQALAASRELSGNVVPFVPRWERDPVERPCDCG